jgi:hypothetical protein
MCPMPNILRSSHFSRLMTNVLRIFPTLVSGLGPIGSCLIDGWGTQSTTCSSFQDSGRTGGKSPCLYVDNCRFFFKF